MELAVSALWGVADALPGKLGALLEQEFELLSGARDDVCFFQAELSSMRAFLLNRASSQDAQIKNWVSQVRELAYDIEDWVDLFALRVDAAAASASSPSTSSSWLLGWLPRGVSKIPTLLARREIAGELRNLKERVIVVSEQHGRYRLNQPAVAAAATMDPRLISLYTDRAGFVGLDGAIEEVVEMVTDVGSIGPKVVSIVGMAGAGKTTLAAEVYRRVSGVFDCHAFVSVGRSWDLRKVLKSVLLQVMKDERGRVGEMEDAHQLIGKLQSHMQHKRYFVIIDDLWSEEAWRIIKCLFPGNTLSNRIITTTRNEIVANACCSSGTDRIYKICLLSDTNSKTLFFKRVFGSVDGCPHYLMDVSTKIMNKCGGLPLAIVSIADALASKTPTRDAFESFGLDVQFNSHLDRMKQILDLSYDDLPAHLKTCLLYLSIFPENYEIDKERLVRRWIAEGFIGGERGASTEGIARSYLSELICRNMIRPSHMDNDGNAKSCVVHPVMLEFVVCKSMEENFVTLLHAQQQDVSTNSSIRRLSLYCNGIEGQARVRGCAMDLSHVRSLTLFGHASGMPRIAELSVVCVLDLEGCEGPVQQCLDGLCKLVLLRYLSLKGTDVSELPAQIGDLQCLETLDVRSTKVKDLPPSIVRLQKLVHLLAGNVKLPGGIGKMRALQTLSCADVEKSFPCFMELAQLRKLRELTVFSDATNISGNERRVTFLSDGFMSLKRLCIECSLPSVTFEPGALPNLEELELRFEKGPADELNGVSGIECLPSLKHVFIEFSHLDARAAATVAAVRLAAATIHPRHPAVTVKGEGESS